MNHTRHKAALEAMSQNYGLPITRLIEMLDRNDIDPTKAGKTMRDGYAELAGAGYVTGAKSGPFSIHVEPLTEEQRAQRMAPRVEISVHVEPLTEEQRAQRMAPRAEISDAARAANAAQLAKHAAFEAAKPAELAAGRAALLRLMEVAQGDSGQCRRVASLLLSCYNGNRFKFDLTDLRGLDLEIFEDCIAVLRMDYICAREVHCYFENGGDLFESLARSWRIRDYTKPCRKPKSQRD